MNELFNKWLINILDAEGKNLKKQRGYAHFDAIIRTKKDLLSLADSFLSMAAVSSWNFLPFIHYNKQERKYTWTKVKNKQSKRKELVKIKNRSILYASHRDSLLYSWYAFQLNTYYEFFLEKSELNECIGAYRLNNGTPRSNITLSNNVFTEIKSRKDCAVLTFDITKFYDTLDKKILKEKWGEIINTYYQTNLSGLPKDHYAIFNAIFNYKCIRLNELNEFLNKKYKNLPENIMKNSKIYNGFICYPGDLSELRENGMIYTKERFIQKLQTVHIGEYDIFNKEIGIPQGSPISPVLANIYLSGFDNRLNIYLKSIGGIYRRYADDILVICEIKQREMVENFIGNEIQNVKLEIQNKKTDWFIFSKGKIIQRKKNESENSGRKLQYLGFDFDGTNTFIRGGSISKYYQKMRRGIRRNLNGALEKDSKATTIRIEKIKNNFLVEKFARYANNSSRILGSLEIKRQLRNAEKNILKFQEIAEIHSIAGKTKRTTYGTRSKIRLIMKKSYYKIMEVSDDELRDKEIV